jgi:hypothetical protein
MSLALQADFHPPYKQYRKHIVLSDQSTPTTPPKKDDQPTKNEKKEPNPKNAKPEVQKWY